MSAAKPRLRDTAMVRRVIAASGSNAYAQATTIAMQLLSLPLFLTYWDLQTYGQWLVLSALPAYLAMADAGIVTAAGNRMTMLVGRGEVKAATQTFQSALSFVLIVCGAAVPLLALAAWQLPVATLDSRMALLVLSIGVLLSLIGGLPEAVYKSSQRYALGTAVANTTRLLEWLGGLVGLWWSGDFLGVALGGVLARLLCTAAMCWHAARTVPALHWGFTQSSRMEIRRCAAPALSFMAFPVANALNFQGMTLIAAAVLGPASTVVFNTYRTLARVTVQATAIFSLALWPEFSRIYGQGQIGALARLYRRSLWMAAALAAGASVIVFVAAPWVLQAWSVGKVGFLPDVMAMAMLYAAVAGAWHVSRVLLLSTNEHSGLAWPYLLASVAALPLGWVLVQALGLIGLLATMLVLELAMLTLCFHLSRRLLLPRGPSAIGAVA